MPLKESQVTVKVDWAHFWWKVAYLIINWDKAKQFEKITKLAPDERFQSFVVNHVRALVDKKVAPPAEITAPIINLAEDISAGRELSLRAGDYIALQTFYRKTIK